jgi:hypothetical protein
MAPDPEEGFRVTDRRRRDAAEEPPTSAVPPAGPAERSLTGLFMMLATEAMIALGDVPDPATGQHQRDLPQAVGVIDVLALLREKTEGNRSGDETRLLDELIYDLQLRYVRATKSSG